MGWPADVILSGKHARLVPLEPSHADAMRDAARDGELWKLWYTNVPSPERMPAEIARRLDLKTKGSMLPFAVLDATGACAGMTSYMNVDAVSRRVEIGSTWYAKRVQRTALNTECKLMLLAHAFEAQDCIAVEFRTSFLNHQSRRAIERLGAKLDGVIRSHQRHSDGSLRDTCVYSIIACEWPAVRAHLTFQLSR
jgi:RimJ/RimL family protein N-acetyltransferase